MIAVKRLLFCFSFIMTQHANAQFSVTFILDHFPGNHLSDTFFIAGNFNGWHPGSAQYSFPIKEDGSSTITLSLAAGPYEYKFTRGEWPKVETTPDGKNLANRSLNVDHDTTVRVAIVGWADDFNKDVFPKKGHTASPNVYIIDTAFYMPQLERERRIWIYLPAGYAASGKKYPVIYMHDGQNLFDEATAFAGEWGVDDFLDSLQAVGNKETIVVGIDNGHAKRMTEYNPYTYAQFGKGEGDHYVDFLVKTLKPFIDKNYRTLKGRPNTFIAGSSMGGLISLYAVLKYPKIFGGAGVFSPSFWTAPGIDSMVRSHAGSMDARLFFYAGGKEGNSMLVNQKRIINEIEQSSTSQVKEVVDPDAQHNEAAWRKHFPQFYEWVVLKK
ncbi:MAG: alpha/beta hydrolase-fold protein [Ginsengibacter sp.]